MHKYIAFILIFLGLANAYSQDKKNRIAEDGLLYLTHLYYNQSNWEALLKLEPSIETSNSQRPEIYSRLGTAFYYTTNYCAAEKFFKKAYKLSPSDEILYLYFYSIYFQGNILEANQLKRKMTDSMIQKIESYTPVSILESISVDGGIKVLDEKETGGNLFYSSLLSTWNLAHDLKLNLGFNYLKQEIFNTSYTQPELYLSTPFAIGKGWTFIPAFHGLINDTKINADPANTTLKSNLMFVQASLSKRIQNLNIETSFGRHFEHYIITDNTAQKTTNETSNQLGISLFYTFNLSKSFKYIFNPNYYYLSQTVNENQTNGIALNISNAFYWNKWQLLTSYLKKDNFLFADNSGLYYYNFKGQIKNRFSISAGKTITPHLDAFITYQNEQQLINQFINLNYTSLFLSLKFKL